MKCTQFPLGMKFIIVIWLLEIFLGSIQPWQPVTRSSDNQTPSLPTQVPIYIPGWEKQLMVQCHAHWLSVMVRIQTQILTSQPPEIESSAVRPLGHDAQSVLHKHRVYSLFMMMFLIIFHQLWCMLVSLVMYPPSSRGYTRARHVITPRWWGSRNSSDSIRSLTLSGNA